MENKNGQGIFYGVIGVATLVVAIIGATFAYFSASATATGDNVTGGTNDDLATALSVEVTRVNKLPTNVASIDLVPTDIDGASASSINTAVAAKCEAKGYTGCHIYRIDAKSTQTVANASVLLNSLTVSGTNLGTNGAADWMYSIYQGTDATATAVIEGGNGAFSTVPAAGFDMHKNAAMTANQTYTYYLLIYLHDDGTAQNEAGENNSTGTYTGSISMNAAGGKASATFSA